MKILRNNKIESTQTSLVGESENTKAYEAPVLISYGDVRDITLGPTAGIGESSGGPAIFEVPRT